MNDAAQHKKPTDRGSGTTKPIVILIHGLWMDGSEMQLLGWRLRRLGYETELFRYRTVQANVVESSHKLWQFLEKRFGSNMKNADEGQVHLVCHSLGGVVAMEMLQRHPQARIGRIVTLGTAFQGSIAAQKISQWTLGRMVLGKSLTRALGGGGISQVPEGREVGILAGDRSLGLGRTIWGIGTPNDGTVAVEETHLQGAKEHQILPVVHVGLVVSTRALQMIHNFLTKGCFNISHDDEKDRKTGAYTGVDRRRKR